MYGGWIDAKPEQKSLLRFLGVKGKMIYNKEVNCFEHCECTYLDLLVLKYCFKGFWGGCWTAFDPETGETLPTEQQLPFEKWDD